MVAYTLAGSVASAFIGGTLGLVGSIVAPVHPLLCMGLLLLLAVLGIVRELGVIALPLPQLRRQTKGIWMRLFPAPLAAALWGFDLGLIFTTWLTFSGVWVLAAAAVLLGNVPFSIALFVVYWFGRALSVWLAPLVVPHASATPDLLDAIAGQSLLFRRVHALGLAWAVIVLVVGYRLPVGF